MTWFKVDDNLHSHNKARDAGLPALGLWVVAGSYCGQYLTEGLVPDWFVASWPSGKRLAARLVEVGLWEQTTSGWQFHQWDERQPTKEQVEAERARTRERQQKWRDRNRDTPVTPPVTNGVSNGVTNGVTNSAPTRPVPKNNQKTPSSADADAVFATFWHMYPRKVGKLDARKVWDRKLKTASPEAITAGLRRYLPVFDHADPQFIPHPATWLQRGSWEDELPDPSQANADWWAS